ncbi:purple acid phosphatase family protein [Novosphingobium rosa]|jgi:acid phosphatase|uniref:purple acid phosphatase family protein n=1 Tax=Novosphingobium rosa TaxID=76978 RepID=UPI00082EA6BC|nr:tartrate-resistant acid phosphatase type 5 family protein [Novosphingobium rosa]
MTMLDISRRDALIGLSGAAVAATLPLTKAAAAAPSLNFLVMGDWGREGVSHQRDVAGQMGRIAQSANARFVVAVGDNFYENGVASVQDPQWRSSYEDVYVAPSLQKPWHALLGNHDYKGTPQAQIDYTAHSSRWKMPARYYQLSGADYGMPAVDMFMLDTSPLVHSYRKNVESVIAKNVASQDVAAQLAWLDRGLAASRAPWKLVFGHHTIYSGGSTHGNTPELIEQVKPILERHGVQAYINGHDHDMQHIRVGAIDYICTGAGSEVRPVSPIDGTLFSLSRSGFSHLALSQDALALEFRDYTGAQVYAASIARERHARAAAG